jgi:hypothetical protein
MVRTVIKAIAQATCEELQEAATTNAPFKAERTRLNFEKVERDLRNHGSGALAS